MTNLICTLSVAKVVLPNVNMAMELRVFVSSTQGGEGSHNGPAKGRCEIAKSHRNDAQTLNQFDNHVTCENVFALPYYMYASLMGGESSFDTHCNGLKKRTCKGAKVKLILRFFSHLPFSLSKRMLSIIVSVAAIASSCVTNTHKADPNTREYDWSVTQPKLHIQRASVVVVKPCVTDYSVYSVVYLWNGDGNHVTTRGFEKPSNPLTHVDNNAC